MAKRRRRTKGLKPGQRLKIAGDPLSAMRGLFSVPKAGARSSKGRKRR